MTTKLRFIFALIIWCSINLVVVYARENEAKIYAESLVRELDKAQLLIDAGKPKQASEVFGRVLLENPTDKNWKSVILTAQAAMLSKADYELEASVIWEQMIAEDISVEAYARVATFREKQGKVTEARKFWMNGFERGDDVCARELLSSYWARGDIAEFANFIKSAHSRGSKVKLQLSPIELDFARATLVIAKDDAITRDLSEILQQYRSGRNYEFIDLAGIEKLPQNEEARESLLILFTRYNKCVFPDVIQRSVFRRGEFIVSRIPKGDRRLILQDVKRGIEANSVGMQLCDYFLDIENATAK